MILKISQLITYQTLPTVIVIPTSSGTSCRVAPLCSVPVFPPFGELTLSLINIFPFNFSGEGRGTPGSSYN